MENGSDESIKKYFISKTVLGNIIVSIFAVIFTLSVQWLLGIYDDYKTRKNAAKIIEMDISNVVHEIEQYIKQPKYQNLFFANRPKPITITIKDMLYEHFIEYHRLIDEDTAFSIEKFYYNIHNINNLSLFEINYRTIIRQSKDLKEKELLENVAANINLIRHYLVTATYGMQAIQKIYRTEMPNDKISNRYQNRLEAILERLSNLRQIEGNFNKKYIIKNEEDLASRLKNNQHLNTIFAGVIVVGNNVTKRRSIKADKHE